MTVAIDRIQIDVHLDEDWMTRAIRADVAAGLTGSPKSLPPKWFYDEAGSALFDQITRLEEYYPTRAEREILMRESPTIAALCDADTFIELGSGTSDKTGILLDALTQTGQLGCFVPFDVSQATLRQAAMTIASRYPGIQVHAIAGDFEYHLGELPRTGQRRLLAFFGGTIGNFNPVARAAFLANIAAQLRPGDSFLLGTDLVKDHGRLVRAYDDARGVTAAFNKNVLRVINRQLGANFDLECFEHVARFQLEQEWIAMSLRSTRHQRVRIVDLDLVVDFVRGEEVLTEISAKFRPERIDAELAAAGLTPARLWTDAAGDFALSLSFKGERPTPA